MKKILVSIIIMTMIFMCGCESGTKDWQTITIEECGTLKIPGEWSFKCEEGTMCILEEDNPVMISYERTGEIEENYYLSDFKYLDFTESAVFSNGAIYGKAKYSYAGKEIERYYLSLGEAANGKIVEFVVWDESIDKELLIDIAKTFVSTI